MVRISLILGSILALTACGSGADSEPPRTTTPSADIVNMTSMERGAILYKRCRACHTLGEGERNRVGPNLWGIFGAEVGARDDFNYSVAMKNSAVVWSDETMSAYLERPSAYIPGNRMSYVGLRNEEDRLALIAYLRSETGG